MYTRQIQIGSGNTSTSTSCCDLDLDPDQVGFLDGKKKIQNQNPSKNWPKSYAVSSNGQVSVTEKKKNPHRNKN